jgi:tRNA pseudouridine38-40 synthase
MRNIKLVIEYDGTHFFGWQSQPQVRTVQDEVERSLSLLTQENIRVHSAGRTDTGVHACGQVVNFSVEKDLALKVFLQGTNALLPRDIRVLSAEQVSDDFHARFSAQARYYRYVIRTQPSALQRHYSWHVPYPLDMNAMQAASSLIAGVHDFKSFCHVEPDDSNFYCQVMSVVWKKSGGYYYFEITANRFLHHMVRVLVATCVDVGKKRMTLERFRTVLAARDRHMASATAPAHGLYLMRVNY